jgi:CheY-like chemotaxis protein
MDGIDICFEMRKHPDRPYTYIILVTGWGGKEQMLDGLEAGADDYLVKPVDPDDLLTRLNTGRRILDLQQQLPAAHRMLREQARRHALTAGWNRAMNLQTLDRELAHGSATLSPVAQDDEDAALAARVNQALRASGFAALRELEVFASDGFVALQGTVPSYYLKQVAQAVCLAVAGVHGLRNELAVVSLSSCPVRSR